MMANGDPVTIRCFSFSNPDSINGPFGTFQLWIDGSNVLGRMTQQTLFGLGTTALLNLSGTITGTPGPIVVNVDAAGVLIALGEPPLSVETPLQITFPTDWSSGTFDGLDVKSVDCGDLTA